MNEKVALPREVAEAIEELRDIGLSTYSIVNRVGHKQSLGSTGLTPYLKVIHAWVDEGNGDILLSALVNGYEIKRTPHEELREYYQSLDDCDSYDVVVSGAVETTLRILGITVEGINDTNTSTDAT